MKRTVDDVIYFCLVIFALLLLAGRAICAAGVRAGAGATGELAC